MDGWNLAAANENYLPATVHFSTLSGFKRSIQGVDFSEFLKSR